MFSRRGLTPLANLVINNEQQAPLSVTPISVTNTGKLKGNFAFNGKDLNASFVYQKPDSKQIHVPQNDDNSQGNKRLKGNQN